MKCLLALYLLLLGLVSVVVVCQAATQTTQTKQQQQQYYDTRSSRRERHLDHWDADTLAFYLGIDEADETTGGKVRVSPNYVYPGYDVAVMFYASWCQNCHAFAPSWDAIATHVKAGTVSSKLIMAVFDCEYNVRHQQLCNAAGVLHYPTLMFMGNGVFHDSDIVTRTILGKRRCAGPAGPSPIPHTVKFQGQWTYADSVLDWIRLMQGFSRWHHWTSTGILYHIRNGLLGWLRPTTNRLRQKQTGSTSLPIGVPSTTATTKSATSSSSTLDINTDRQVSLLQNQLTQSQDELALMEKAVSHSSLLLDAILMPPTTTTSKGHDDVGDDKNVTTPTSSSALSEDVFAVMNETNAWSVAGNQTLSGKKDHDATATDDDEQADTASAMRQILWSCVVELSLDYCSRLSTKVATDYLKEMENRTDFPTMAVIETLLKDRIVEQEPYCGVLDDCLATDFASDICKPAQCPFQQEVVACRYVNACLDPTIQKEYAIGLGIITKDDEFPPRSKTTTTTTEQTTATESGMKKKKRAWGF